MIKDSFQAMTNTFSVNPTYRDFFKQNPRLGMLVGMLDKMSAEKKQQHIENAETFLAQL